MPPYRMTNLRSQPVELHLSDRVLVLAPYEQTEISEAELATPQLSTFLKRRLVSVQPALVIEPQLEEGSDSEPSTPTAEQPRE